jgi:hypothetical protein
MSLISVLDERAALVDLPLLAVETVELLGERGYRFIEIDPAERSSMAVNVLALGRGRLLALEENERTNERLRAEGFDVRNTAKELTGVGFTKDLVDLALRRVVRNLRRRRILRLAGKLNWEGDFSAMRRGRRMA